MKKIACFVCDSQHQRVIFLFPPSSRNMVRFDLFNGAMLTSFLIDIKRDDNKWVKRRRLTFNFSLFLSLLKRERASISVVVSRSFVTFRSSVCLFVRLAFVNWTVQSIFAHVPTQYKVHGVNAISFIYFEHFLFQWKRRYLLFFSAWGDYTWVPSSLRDRGSGTFGRAWPRGSRRESPPSRRRCDNEEDELPVVCDAPSNNRISLLMWEEKEKGTKSWKKE